ncbi:FtsK/SpoIIIE domain-containing protein [Staphylococcus aureus]|nr:FtsK/SpoIIIE domain-containing protein [Staphylococcus aureus]MDN8977705.1 FtsK/SpoIIIE domain-containing protein [Staphylococcus aureus]
MGNKRNVIKDPTHIMLGMQSDGEILSTHISGFPHAIIAGTTGSGKSVGMQSILLTNMAIAKPDEVDWIIVDPKGNEFGKYKGNPYLLLDPIINLERTKDMLEYLCIEMDYRSQLMQKHGGIRNIGEFNKAVEKGKVKGEKKLSYVIALFDEFADLMEQYKDDVELYIKRIAQKGRSSGIHLLLGTQSPRRETIKGGIKANLPTRIAFKTASTTESLVAVGETGPEKLSSKRKGEFYHNLTDGGLKRARTPFISDEEIDEILSYMKETYEAKPKFDMEKEIERKRQLYKSLVAENEGVSPEEIDEEELNNPPTKNINKKLGNSLASQRTSEEKIKAKKQYEITKKKLEENKALGKAKSKTVSVDMSKFLKAKTGDKEDRKKQRIDKNKNAGIVPTATKKDRLSESNEQKTNSIVSRNVTESNKTQESSKTIDRNKEQNKKQNTNKKTEQVVNKRNGLSNQERIKEMRKAKRKRTGSSPLAKKR